MNESPLTPREKFQQELFNNPSALFRQTLVHTLVCVIPSIGLMVVWFITRDPAWAITGYGILLYYVLIKLYLAKIGIQRQYEIQKKMAAKREIPHDVS